MTQRATAAVAARVVQPNAAKAAAPCFEAPMVLQQMRCAGLLEVCLYR